MTRKPAKYDWNRVVVKKEFREDVNPILTKQIFVEKVDQILAIIANMSVGDQIQDVKNEF